MCLNKTIYLNWTPTFEWYLIWCGSRMRHQEKTGLLIQNMITIPNSIVKRIGGEGGT